MGGQLDIIPGYSPWPYSRQDTPFLSYPGPQGLEEGIQGGQGVTYTPTQQFFGEGNSGTAAPSFVPQGGNMWNVFGGSGEAPSSFALRQSQFDGGDLAGLVEDDQDAPPGGPSDQPMSIPNVIQALGKPANPALATAS